MRHCLKHDQFQLNEYLSNLEFLVLDEADRMLTDETIQDDLNHVLDACEKVQEKRRQTFLFSATLAKNFESLFPKERIFGKFLPENKENYPFDCVEVGNSE